MYGTLVSESSDYTIALKQGWNQIGNPFTFNINFSDIKVRYNGVTKTLSDAADAHWIGNYAFSYPNQATGYQLVHPTIVGATKILEPWLGYWVNSAFDLEILIPPTKALKAKEVAGDDNFNLKITASIDDLKENIIIGKDKQNQLIPLPPSPLQNNIEIYLQKGESKYLAEFDDMINQAISNEFVVNAPKDKKVKLEFIADNLSDYYLYLADLQISKETDITNKTYEFISDGSERKFKLQISKADKTLLSQDIKLENIKVFPNPITKTQSINLEAKFSNGLPVNADIEIYNKNGKLILKENVLPEYQGKGKVKLSSPNLNNSLTTLANGIYFGRITFYNAVGEKVSKVVKIAVMK